MENENNNDPSTSPETTPSENIDVDDIAAASVEPTETTDAANLAASESNSAPSDETSAEPTLDGEGDPTAVAQDASADNSGELATKKAEAAQSAPISVELEPWRKDLKRFYGDVNSSLTEKEEIKLECLNRKVKNEFVLNWKVESNKCFQLCVNLRRRSTGGKFGGKVIA
jgi:hypothetical protein